MVIAITQIVSTITSIIVSDSRTDIFWYNFSKTNSPYILKMVALLVFVQGVKNACVAN